MRKLSLGAVLLLVVALGCATKEETSIKIYVQQKLYDKAIAQGSQALLKNPNNGDTHYYLGAAYYGKDGDLKQEAEGYADSSEVYMRKAFAHFSKAKELSPGSWGKSVDDNIVSMFGRHFNRGVIASKRGDHAIAASEYALARVADPENYQSYYAHAGSLWPLASAAKTKGDDAEFTRITDALISDLNKVLELNPPEREVKVNTHTTLGEVHFKRGENDKAMEQYVEAIKMDPENYELMDTIGQRLYNSQDWVNAVKYLDESLAIQERLNLVDTDDIETLNALAGAQLKLGKRDDAIVTFDKLLKLVANDPAKKANVLYNVMVTYYKAGESAEKEGNADSAKENYNKCIACGSDLLKIESTRAEIFQVLGYCRRGIGDTAGAARDLKRFSELRTQTSGR